MTFSSDGVFCNSLWLSEGSIRLSESCWEGRRGWSWQEPFFLLSSQIPAIYTNLRECPDLLVSVL